MTKGKHTPGPRWYVEAIHGKPECSTCGTKRPWEEADCAEAVGWGPCPLHAAAGDLADALEGLTPWACWCSTPERAEAVSHGVAGHETECDAARAALKKAGR